MEIRYFGSADGKSLFIRVSGDCDLYSFRDFFNRIAVKITNGCSKAILDFTGVSYLDSSGVGAIIRIIRLAKEKQIVLKWRGIRGTPRKVLEMSNILPLITEER